MATMPAFPRRNGAVGEHPAQPAAAYAAAAGAPAALTPVTPRAERNPNRLRALPLEDVFFYCKKIDNSRLVRETDPRSAAACWRVIRGACVIIALFAGGYAPQLMATLDGYKLEALRAEQRSLLDERRNLQWKEAELLNMNRLEQLAKQQNLTPPAPGQVVRLNGKDSSVAMNQPR